jgi:hypothetical protein
MAETPGEARENLITFLSNRNDKRLLNIKFFAAPGSDTDRKAAAARRIMERLWSGQTVVNQMPKEAFENHSTAI